MGKSVSHYIEEFHRLKARVDLHESEIHQVARYLGGLNEILQEHLSLQSIWRLSEAVNLAYKVKSNQTRHANKFSAPRRHAYDSFEEFGQALSVQKGSKSSSANVASSGQHIGVSKGVKKVMPLPIKTKPYIKSSTFRY